VDADEAEDFWQSLAADGADNNNDDALLTDLFDGLIEDDGDTNMGAAPVSAASNSGGREDVRSWPLEKLQETLENLGEDVEGLDRETMIQQIEGMQASIAPAAKAPLAEPVKKEELKEETKEELKAEMKEEAAAAFPEEVECRSPQEEPPILPVATATSTAPVLDPEEDSDDAWGTWGPQSSGASPSKPAVAEKKADDDWGNFNGRPAAKAEEAGQKNEWGENTSWNGNDDRGGGQAKGKDKGKGKGITKDARGREFNSDGLPWDLKKPACSHWETSGTCPFGKICSFHHEEQPEPDLSNPARVLQDWADQQDHLFAHEPKLKDGWIRVHSKNAAPGACYFVRVADMHATWSIQECQA